MSDPLPGVPARAPASSAPDADPAAPDAPATRAMRFRAWHRGTREADFMIGGFFDRHHDAWSPAEADWFARLLDEEDVDIMAWMLGRGEPPAPLGDDPVAVAMLTAMRRLDYIAIP